MRNDTPTAHPDEREVAAQKNADFEMPVQPVQVGTEPASPLLTGGITRTLSPTQPFMPATVRESNGRFRRGAPSPNPSGRAAVAPEVKEAAQAHTPEMLSVLVSVARDDGAPPAARVAAANAVLDRGHGKPLANIEAKVATMDLNQMHLDALREMSNAPRS